MLVDSLARGGAERLAVDVASALDRERFAPFFVVTRQGGPLEALLRDGDVPVTIIERHGKGVPVRMLARAHRLLREADVIHAHLFTSSMYGAVLSRTTGVPLVTRDPTWDGVRSFVRTRGYRHLIGPTARAVICPSDRVARSIEEEGVPREKLVVIDNGVKTGDTLPRDAARAELGLAQDAWVVGIVATLRIEKSHETLLRAFSALRGRSGPTTLCIVGDGPRRGELETLADQLGIRDDVVWAGDRHDARRLATAFDAAVICSAWEGLPFAALEVMAAGVPLVATRVGALPDVLDGGAGVLVDVGDDQGLARELEALRDDPVRAAAVAARAKRTIDERYAFDTMIERFADVYERALDGGPRGAQSG